ncbi:SDR family NAD(P)-dependent oxidoreductase [Mycolicibacterium sediminis]|uniref:Polyketide synthase n=1 Tax=Mycolicibacterium sediminis TaxID=1286180 RepID=A0A7I7QS78_9MYCO|nr:type I polyketide synthase [Mycolicibacterium sediminis]BBY29239.1 polyketide synthase [Mycolicibacterium sediminis]
MTDALDAADLRHWLTDYLVTTIGCSPDDVDPNASFNDLGVGSRDSVVLSGVLAERIGRAVSPVEFWEHPTINSLARFLTEPEPEPSLEPAAQRGGGSIDEPIAVIGLGCRFPAGIDGPEGLWRFLDDGGSAITEVPADRWTPFDDGSAEVAALLKDTTKWGSFLDDVDAFDAEFFDIMPREAAKMDPQQRLLLEVAWEALEHAGTAPNTLRHSQTGVFIGACVSEYGYLASADLPTVDAWNNTGGALSIIANRLSYFLDLRGPSLTVDTACSSSLVAIHLACQSLRTGDSDVALAGGVNLLMSPAVFRGFDQAAALSPTGACHSFDAAADGFVRGEGCGVAVLKRLSDAQRDGDRVLAVVRGSAVNQDGRSNGLMAPNPAAQMAVLRRAYENAGVSPRDVDYVEAHGTGTFLGDPIEARALGTVLGRGRPADAPLLIGAVKSNLGHLEAAAGIAGFIKTVLSVQRARIPGNHHFDTPNPHIAFDKLRLQVAAAHQDWPTHGRARRAGVSSFGFGGTNAHIVLEQAPAGVAGAAVDLPEITTLPIFGKTDARVATTAAALADWMTGAGAGVPLADIAHTLRHHRDPSNRVASICARDRDQALAGLRALAAGEPADTVVEPGAGPTRSGTVFVYSGQGSHWTGMGRRLLADEPAFAAAIAELEPTFVERVGFSLHQVLSEGEEVRGDARVQPVLVGLQLALTALWRSYGVHPDAVIGHSVGEVSAAVVSGALSVADGLTVVAHRSRLMSRLAGQGAVALLKLDSDATEVAIADFADVSIAGRLAPNQTVIAGLPDQVDAVIAAVSAQNRFARRVNMEVASHTALMDEVLPELRTQLAGLSPNSPAIPFFSTVQDPMGAPVHDAEYWAANVRRPVLFADAVVAAARDHGTFVEISAHPILASAVAETLESDPHLSIGTLRRDGDDTLNFHLGVATVSPLSPTAPHPPEPHPLLPTTPWHHGRHWISVAAPRRIAAAATDGVPAEWFSEMTWPQKDLATPAPQTVGSWLVVGDDDVVAEVVAALGPRIHVNALAPSALEDAEPATLVDVLAGTSHVVYAPGVTSSGLDAETGYRLFGSAKALTTAITRLMLPPKLFLLTRDAQPIAEGDAANPAQAVLWGLGRTLALEHPEIWGAVIDVEATTSAPEIARIVLAEATGSDGEDQVVHRGGSRHVPRLRRVTPDLADAIPLDGDHCHLVIGATGNIGPYLIAQLADMKASTVVAVSRNPGERLDDLAAALAEKGSTLITVAADAADEGDMRALFDRFGADLPPLGGIYLAAFGGGPVTLADMTDEHVAAMFRPKLDVLALLHELSLSHAVQRFVLFSSISGLLGSRWLAHYAATTTYLDTFAYARRAAGLPATTVNWGFWKSLADHQSPEELNVTVASGLIPMSDDVAIAALSTVTAPTAAVRSCVVAADWDLLATAYRTRASLHVIDDLIAGADAPVSDVSGGGGPVSVPSTDFRQSLREREPEGRRALLTQHVTALVATVMGLDSPHSLDPKAGFFHFGMDSLMSVTLQRALTTSLGISVPASVVFDYPTVEALVGHLADTLPEFGDDTTGPAGDDDRDYDHLSEDELFALLSERLGSSR